MNPGKTAQALAGVRALLFRQKNDNLNYLVFQTTKEKKQHMSTVFFESMRDDGC